VTSFALDNVCDVIDTRLVDGKDIEFHRTPWCSYFLLDFHPETEFVEDPRITMLEVLPATGLRVFDHHFTIAPCIDA
jgi:hypothetical protein